MSKNKKSKKDKVRKIKVRVVGIGGGGGSVASKISRKVKEASFYAVDTDARALKRVSKNVKKVRLGKDITRGLGTGMDFEMGEKIAKEEKSEIKEIFKDQDVVILIGCLGGGFASGAASILADESKKMGNITYGVFTLPFQFEGRKKAKIAKKSLKKIKKNIDAFSIIPNDRIFKIIEKSAPLKEALAVINQHLAQSIRGLLETIYGTGIINIDFADLETVFSGRGKLAYLNSIRVKKKDKKEKVFKKIIGSPLYPYTIKNGKGVLFNISGQRNLSLAQVNNVAEAISKKVSRSAKIIFGISKSKKKTITRVNLLVVGCDESNLLGKKKQKSKKRKKTKKKERVLEEIPEEKTKKVKIENLGLPPKTVNLLSKNQIKTVAGLIRRKKESLLDIDGIGPGRLKKVDEALELLGLNLKKKEPEKKKGAEKTKKKQEDKEKQKKEKKSKKKKKKKDKKKKKKIRKNALQVKEDIKKAKKEIISKENMWEKPTFLRKK